VGNLIFLVGAVVLSVVGSVWLWLRSRPPTSVMSSIDGFREEMSALSGERPPASSGPPTPRRQPRPGRGRAATDRARSRRPGAGRSPARPPAGRRPRTDDEGDAEVDR